MAQYRSKYDPDLLEKAVRLLRQADSDSHGIEAIFDSLERAPWWEEVGVGYVFAVGEPFRAERDDNAHENVRHVGPELSLLDEFTYFRDTRWTSPTPPPPPLAVGDVIKTEEQAASLPVGTIAVTMANEPIRKAGINEWRMVNAERSPLVLDYMMADEDDQIIYLPEAGGGR